MGLSVAYTHNLRSQLSSIPGKCCLPSALCLGCQSSPCSLRWRAHTHVGNHACVLVCTRVCVSPLSCADVLDCWSTCVFVHDQLKKASIIVEPVQWNNSVCSSEKELTLSGNKRSYFRLNTHAQLCPFTDDKWHKLTLRSAMQSIVELWKVILAHSSSVKPL